MIVAGCDGSLQAPPEQSTGPVDVRPYVTGAALSSLGPGGTFETEPAAEEPFNQITPEVARVQAVAAARAFGPGLRSYLEGQHGAAIDFRALRPTRVFYGTSAYDQTTPSDFQLGIRKVLGPYYFVVLSSGGDPVVSVAVSAYNTNVLVKGDTLRILTVEQGHDFRLKGIKRGDVDGLPVSPERAVQIAAIATGVRVAGPPRLQLATRLHIPQAASWRVPLERSVKMRGAQSGSVFDVTEVVVGPDRRAVVATTAGSARTERIMDPLTRRTFDARIRNWVPIALTPITLATVR